MELSVGSFDSALDPQLGDLHEIGGEHRSANKQFEVLGTLGEANILRAVARKTSYVERTIMRSTPSPDLRPALLSTA
jgi:hypothetical protein